MKDQLKYIINQGLPHGHTIPESYIDGIVDGILLSFKTVHVVINPNITDGDYASFSEEKAYEYLKRPVSKDDFPNDGTYMYGSIDTDLI